MLRAFFQTRQKLITILTKIMQMKQPDAMSETRNSTERPPSLWLRLKYFICPCLLPLLPLPISAEKASGAIITSANSRTSETNHSSNHYKMKQAFGVNGHLTLYRSTKRKNSMQEEKGERRETLLARKTKQCGNSNFRETINIELGYNYRLCSIDELDCAVCNLAEGVLLPAGSKNRQLLVKVSRVNVSIGVALLKREIGKRRPDKKEQKKYREYQFNKHWDQRYVLFQKFDQGIKIDEVSWTVNPPEQVSEYIASKCNGAKIILDAFAGVGGNAIKLANINSCVKVIANQQNKEKMGFLLNNAKVYEVDSNIQLSQRQFLGIERGNIDVVVIQPPLAELHLNLVEHKEILMKDFYPALDKIINKAFCLASNLILLLPPETNIDSLCSCISKCASDLRKMKDFCSIKIQKIYCQTSIKYILVCVGTLVQTEVKLNDELQYMYSRLKKPNEVYFKHKKVMKKLREDYGMLELFNLVKESERVRRDSLHPTDPKKQTFAIDIFYQLIRMRDLIAYDKLAKMIIEQDAEYQRQSSYFHSITNDQNELALSPMMEQQKIDENPFNIREEELTQSDYSHYSYLSSLDKKSLNKSQRSFALLTRERPEWSNPSIIINRVNDSKEKDSKNNSPLTPSRREKRAPDIVQGEASGSPKREQMKKQ